MPTPDCPRIWCTLPSVLEDRDGNVWAGSGTSGGTRPPGGRPIPWCRPLSTQTDQVRTLFEDREGDLWVGGNCGLIRLRDDAFTAYGRTEGMPSDEPNAVFQDHAGRIWVGFHDAGLMLFSGGQKRVFTTRDGMPDSEIFAIRESPGGDLLLSTRDGLVRACMAPPFTLSELHQTLSVTLVLRGCSGRFPRPACGWRLPAAWWNRRAKRFTRWPAAAGWCSMASQRSPWDPDGAVLWGQLWQRTVADQPCKLFGRK